jgi:chromosome segregation ATPase
MRDVIFQIRVLTDEIAINVKDSYQQQVRDLITQISQNLTNKDAAIGGLTQEIENAKALLSQFVGNDNLYTMAQGSCKLIRESRKQNTQLQQELSKAEESVLETKSENQAQSQELDSLKQQLAEQKKTTASLRRETDRVLREIHVRTGKLCNAKESAPPEKLSALRDELINHLTLLEEEHISLGDFVRNLNSILKLQPFSDIRSGMNDIVECLSIPKKSELFLNTECGLSRLKGSPEDLFRNFLCNLCLRLTELSQEELEGRDVESVEGLLLEATENALRTLRYVRGSADDRQSLPPVKEGEVADDVFRFLQSRAELAGNAKQMAELKKEIDQLKRFLTEKESEVRLITGRMKDCEARFLAYLERRKGEGPDAELDEACQQELQEIIDLFKNAQSALS